MFARSAGFTRITVAVVVLVTAAGMGLVWLFAIGGRAAIPPRQMPATEAVALAGQAVPVTRAAPVVSPDTPSSSSIGYRQLHLRASMDAPGDVIAEVSNDANDGHPVAMRLLGKALAKCDSVSGMDDPQIERHAAAASIMKDEMEAQTGRTLIVAGQADSVKAATALNQVNKALRDNCTPIAPERSRDWFRWSERAAAKGNHDARLDLAENADVAPHLPPAERTRLRQLAEHYLRQDVASGQCDVVTLSTLSAMGSTPAIAYIYISLMPLPARAGMDTATYQRELAALREVQNFRRDAVPELQRAAALRQIRALRAGACRA